MSDSRSKNASTKKPSRWTPTGKDQIDPGADVVLAFRRLMLLCHHNNGFCEVGILNTDPGNHDLGIFVFEVSPLFDPPSNLDLGTTNLIAAFDLGDTGKTLKDIVDIRVVRPSVSGVSFFLPSGTPKTYPNDFRFIIDLEGPCFYDGIEIPKNAAAFGPRLHVSDGVFYTLCKTARMFVSREEGASTTCDFNSVAHIVGANIYLDKSDPTNPGHVILKTKGKPPLQLPVSAGKKYLVFVDNSCPTDVCDPTASDQPLYYTAVSPPGGRKKIFLEKGVKGSGPSTGVCAPDFLDTLNSMFAHLPVKKFIFMTDDTPCGAAGAGSSGTLGP